MSKAQTTESWTDSIGQTIKPGDYVSVATISGRSPQMVVAQIVSLNTHDAKGLPFYRYSGDAAYTSDYYEPDEDELTVTVTAIPVFDGRGFYRSNNEYRYDPVSGKRIVTKRAEARKTTYRIIGNVMKLSNEQVASITAINEKLDAEVEDG